MKTSLNKKEKEQILKKLSIKLLDKPLSLLDEKIEKLNSCIALAACNLSSIKKAREAYYDYKNLLDKYPNLFPNSDIHIGGCLDFFSSFIYLDCLGKRIRGAEAFNDSVDEDLMRKIRKITSYRVLIPNYIKDKNAFLYYARTETLINNKYNGAYNKIIFFSNDENDKREDLNLITNLVNGKNRELFEEMSRIWRSWEKIIEKVYSCNSVISLYNNLPSLKEIIEEVIGEPLDSIDLKEERCDEKVNNLIKNGIK